MMWFIVRSRNRMYESRPHNQFLDLGHSFGNLGFDRIMVSLYIVI